MTDEERIRLLRPLMEQRAKELIAELDAVFARADRKRRKDDDDQEA